MQMRNVCQQLMIISKTTMTDIEFSKENKELQAFQVIVYNDVL